MKFRQLCISSLALTMLATVVSAPVEAQNNTPPRRPVLVRFVPFSQAAANDAVRGLYVAIMGEVANPGTYHVDPSELNLNSVVKRAGGLTSDATKSIRLIRQGRLNQQISFAEDSEKSTNLLSPGDLIIVDSKQTPDTVGKLTEFERDPTAVAAGYEVAAPPTGVQLALLNVLDYPLIVTLPPEEATAGNLIESLGQSAELLANTRLIATSSRGRSSEGMITLIGNPAMPLTSRTAVVFDRGAVNRNRLPATLPKPIESDIATAAQSGLIGSPRGQSVELRNVGQQMYISSTNSPNTNSSNEVPSLHPNISDSTPAERSWSEQQSEDHRIDLPGPGLSKNPKVANLPFTGTVPITKSSTSNMNSVDPVIEPIPQPDDAAQESSSVSDTRDSSLTLDEPVESPAPNSSIPLAVIALAISGAVIGVGILWSHRWERQSQGWLSAPEMPSMFPVSETSLPAFEEIHPPVVKTLLARIINNELPLTLEVVEFPTEIALQGRIATKPLLRVDGPQELVEGPHFTLSDQTLEEPSLQQVIAQMDGPETMPRRPHFMTKEKQHVAAPAGLTRDPQNSPPNREGASSNAPLASALFDLERGDRS